MLASGGSNREVCPQLTMMLQSVNLFPQAAQFLKLKDLSRLTVASRDIIPEAWEDEVWHVVAKSGCTGFRRNFKLSNLSKRTVQDFMKHVVYTTLVFDNEAVVVDSESIASTLIRFASESMLAQSIRVPRSLMGFAATSFFTRFQFDEESLEEHAMDSSEIAFSMPAVFDLRGDQCFLELTLHENGLKLSMHNYSKAEFSKNAEGDDEEDEEPVALNKPLRVQLCSISSPVVVRNEYLLTYTDVDVPGYGVCDMPLSKAEMTQALVNGFLCMVSVTEMMWDELDDLRLDGRCCC
jgi:hypothetical protein